MPRKSIQGLLLDLSGTVYVDDSLIEGAARAIKAVRAAELPLLFVTNTTSKPRARILKKMDRLGLSVSDEAVFTAPVAACEVLKEAGHKSCHFLLPPGVEADFPGIETNKTSPDAVVVGDIGNAFDYSTLNQAFDLIMRGAEFYALADNRYFESDGALKLDVGPFVRALEYASGREATLTGKPAAAFFHTAAQNLGLDPAAVAMVGDDIESDVGGAIAAGLRGILVRTGKYRHELAERSSIDPDHTLDSIADLPNLLGL